MRAILIMGIISGALAAIYGVMLALSGAMSDSPYQTAGKIGCIVALCGAVLVVGCIVGLFI